MDTYPQWWRYAIVLTIILGQAALGLRLWQRSRVASIVAIVVLSTAGLAVSSVAMAVPEASARAFTILAGVHVIYCLILTRLLRENRNERIQTAMAALYSFGVIGVPAMATRANLAGWRQESATAVPAFVAALAAVVFFVGRAAYNRMIDLERQDPPQPAGGMLAITWFLALSMVVAGVLSIVAVAGLLGFDVQNGRRQLGVTATEVYLLACCATLCLIAAGFGWLRRPRTAADDNLRVSPTALALCSVGLAGAVGVLVADLAGSPWGWAVASPYFILLGVVNGLHYLEDLVYSQARVHCLNGEWPAWFLGVLCGLSITVGVLWLGERVLWGPARQGAALGVTVQGVGVLALVLVAVFAANLVVSFGAGPHQRLTLKNPASNAIQSQVLYGAQTVVTTCVPSTMLSMISSDVPTDFKPLFVGTVFAALMWTIAKYALKNNAEHLERERTRPLSGTVTRRLAEKDRRQLQAAFVKQLSRHIALQERLSRWTFNVSLLRVFVVVAKLFEWVKESDDAGHARDGVA
jgi:hypothetical protein